MQKRVSKKIGILRREGERPDVAQAIAYNMARRGRLTKSGGHVGGRRGKRVTKGGKRVTLRKGYKQRR